METHQALDESVAATMAEILVYGMDNLAYESWDRETRTREHRRLTEVLYRYVRENDCELWAQATGIGGEHG